MMVHSERKHGTPYAYTCGCRCAACREAQRAMKVARRERRRRAREAGEVVDGESKPCIICSAPVRRFVGEEPAQFARRHLCGSNECKRAQTITQRYAGNPRSVGGRTLIAQTCIECREFLPSAAFKRDRRDGSHSRKCMRCSARLWYAQIPEPDLGRQREKKRRFIAGLCADTLPGAVRKGYQWTGPELEIIATRNDLSVSELAGMLGRTYGSVVHMRQKVLREPKYRRLAGA